MSLVERGAAAVEDTATGIWAVVKLRLTKEEETAMFVRLNVIAVAALMFVGSAASAQTANAQTSKVDVRVADLDLASHAGRAVLEQRIGHAVDRICGSPHTRSTWEVQNYATCSQTARAQVQSQVDAMVAAAENARKMAGTRGTTPAM
jgi:UrcA family protein